MQVSSKMLFKTAIIGLAVLLMLGLFLTLGSTTQQANALNTTQWETVRGYIESYFSGQYQPGLEGEAGLRMSKTSLWNGVDSNGDISPAPGAAAGSAGTTVTGVAGEGDDMANRPVLIDNLRTQTAMIPGTEFRCMWNVNEDCFSNSSVSSVRDIVDNHQEAGFSTDIVVYCVSAHTAAPVTAGFGILAQVPGALATDTGLTPNVYALEWARNGWRDNLSNPPAGANTTAAPEASAGGYSAPGSGWAPSACTTAVTDYDLVRCTTNWAISSTGGNVGNGTATMSSPQSIDIRTGSISTLSNTSINLQIPVNTLFSTSSLANIAPTTQLVVAPRTQHGGTTAMGLKMLGYNVISGGFINGGLYRWNSTLGELQVDQNVGLPLQSVAAASVPGAVDTTPPTITTGSAASSVTTTSADISRVAAEPATMKVEYGTTSGGPYTNTVNNTVLNASKTVSLSGLSEGTTYYVRVTSYDGYANGATESEISFTTPCSVGKPPLTLATQYAYWASMADYTNGDLSVVYNVTAGALDAYNVAITGSSNTNGVTLLTATPASVGNIAATTMASITLKYDIPTGVTQFNAVVTGSGENQCAIGYTYP